MHHPGLFGILKSATPSWTQLDYEEFTSDLGGYTSAGVDCYWDSSNGESGTGCMLIRDNSATSVGTLTTGLDIQAYSSFKVDFWFLTSGYGTNHDFFLEYFDGTDWIEIGQWVLGTDFTDGVEDSGSVTITDVEQTFPVDAQIRFIGSANNDSDFLYLDNIEISAL